MYIAGARGVSHNPAKAKELLEKAANQGHIGARKELMDY